MPRRLQDLWLNMPLARKGALVAAIPVACLLLSLSVILALVIQADAAQREAVRGDQIRSAAQSMLVSLLNAETAVRGYALTHEERFLQPFRLAQNSSAEELSAFQALTRDLGPNAGADHLAGAYEARLKAVGNTVEAVRRDAPKGYTSRQTLRFVETGKARMDEFRIELDRFSDNEVLRLARLKKQADDRGGLFFLILVGSTILGIAGGVGASLLFSSGIVSRLQTVSRNAEAAVLGGPLKPLLHSRDEIGRLSDGLQILMVQLHEREDELRKASSFQEAILGSAGQIIMSSDTSGVIQSFNAAAEVALGYSAEEVIGKITPAIFHVPEEVVARADFLSNVLGRHIEPGGGSFTALADEGIVDVAEWTYVRKDGSRFPVQLALSRVLDAQGKSTGYVGVAVDLTQRKATEQALIEATVVAEEASRAKSEFLATMSHEIRTPMNAIIGTADLLWDTQLTDEQREYVRIFRRAGNGLLELINNILDFSKIEAGHLELETVDFSPAELSEKTAGLMALQATAKGLELLTSIHRDVPERVLGDPHRLRQILMNLLGNAVKFTARGEVVLSVRTEVGSDGRSGLLFEVRDTGAGISPEKQATIFESFSQEDSSTTRTHGGTGLGLTISRRLAELMGGSLSVESVPGEGSTFRLWAPFLVTQEMSENPDGEVSLQGLSVLVVDDNATNRSILQDTLSGWEVRAATAGSADEALRLLEQSAIAGTPFDLALLDGRMPVRDGFSLTREIRGDPRLSSLPIIILTSASQTGDLAQARELGIAAYLLKPVRRDELRGAIRTATRRSTVVAEATQTSGAAPQPATERILVVEDSEDNRLIVQAYLKRSRFIPEFAHDGQEGVEKFMSNGYSLVLMDVQMPVMDGYEATRRIREWEREQGHPPIPIVALTANAFREDEERCREAGCSGFLSKPIKKATLLEVLDDHLGPAALVE